MNDLATWVEKHHDEIVETATDQMLLRDRIHDQFVEVPSLVRDEVERSVRAEVRESVQDFFEAFHKAAAYDNPSLLNGILVDWIEARPVPTQEETAGLLPALSTLKMSLWDQIVEYALPEEYIDLLRQTETIFTEAANFLAALEADALLNYVRADLTRAKRHVEHLDKRKSDFISVAAHELKTPLTLIEGYNNMLNSTFPAEDHPNVALMTDGIGKGASRLREIIQDMIDVSMIDMALLKLYFQPVWLARVIDAVLFDMREKLSMRNIEVIVEQDTLPTSPTYADPERLAQAIFKIMSNAVKYTPDGGVITISAERLPGFIDLTITDTGIGIDPEYLTHIFEKFSSMAEVATHSSGKVKFKGAGPGLGLAIAKGIMEAHDGTIWAESEGYDENRCPGSTFHIMIPIRAAPPEDHMATLFEADGRADSLQ